jgi:hypothetical protein
MVPPIDAYVRTGRSRVLARMATTGIYLLRGLPRDLQQAARARALSEGTTLHSVLLQGLREYAAGTWTPQSQGPSADVTGAGGGTGRQLPWNRGGDALRRADELLPDTKEHVSDALRGGQKVTRPTPAAEEA